MGNIKYFHYIWVKGELGWWGSEGSNFFVWWGKASNIPLFCQGYALSIILLFSPVILSRNVAWSVDISVFKSLLYFPFEASHSFSILYAFLSHSKFHFFLKFPWLSTISDSLENKLSHTFMWGPRCTCPKLPGVSSGPRDAGVSFPLYQHTPVK